MDNNLSTPTIYNERIKNHFQELNAILREVAAGNFEITIPELKEDDEFAELFYGIKLMADDLHDMLKNIKIKSEEIEQAKSKLEEEVKIRTDEQAKLKASISNLTLGFIMTNKQNEIVSVNNAALRMLNMQEIHMLSQLSNLQFNKTNLDIAMNVEICLQQKTPINLSEVSVGDISFHIVISPIIVETKVENEAVIGCVILMQDITEEKMLQRSRDEFFSIASHELRTPLTAIMGYTSMIQDYYSDKITSEDIKKMIANINKSSLRLISIVNDFLDMSRLELGKIKFKITELDLVDIIKNVISEYQVTSSRKNLYLNFIETIPLSSIPHVYGDIDRVKQVLVNIIGNGLKFTKEGGITVALQKEDKFVKILISDTGAGMTEQSQKFLFKKFQQANENIYSRDSSQGTGLGLYITRLIMESMGGKAELETTKIGIGTTFSLSIPITSTSIIADSK